MLKDLFLNQPFWQQLTIAIIATGLVALIGFFIRFIWRKFRRHSQSTDAAAAEINYPTQVAIGRGITQEITTDKSRGKIVVAPVQSKTSLKADTFEKSVVIKAESGATINVNIYNYQDGVANSEKPDVRTYFAEGLKYYGGGRFKEAIEEFERCLEIETDHERLGSLNLQIGNCYYNLNKYPEAEKYYRAGLSEARKARDREGEAAALGSLANSYMMRPASGVEARGNNVRDAVQCYKEAMEIYRKDEYPVEYAGTQNNLGNAYKDLPAATPEERAQNVKEAVQCYKEALEIRRKDKYPVEYAMTQNNLGNAYRQLQAATPEEWAQNVKNAVQCHKEALEIYRKDEYPQRYCFIAANIGLALASVRGTEMESCHWLKEAYALKEYLPDQGKGLEEIMKSVCRE